jgi:SNF2 family DNA or RNA helicase
MASLFQNIKMVTQPEGLSVKLFPHQLSSIYKMEQLEATKRIEKETYVKETKIGINADLTGYGKTLAMIGLMVRDKMSWDVNFPYVNEIITSDNRGLIRRSESTLYDKVKANLILVSQSIIGQWENELRKSTLSFTSIASNKDIEKTNIDSYDVILVTPSFYNKVVIMNSKIAWKRFIFDEPGNIRIAGMFGIQAGFSWFITATPLSIYNNYKNCKGSFIRDIFCWSNVVFDETFLPDIIVQNNPDFVKNSFKMPDTEHFYYYCYHPIYTVVSNYVNSTVKTMIEAGNIEGAVTALGGTSTSNIVDLIKSKKINEIINLEERIKKIDPEKDVNQMKELKDKKIHIEIQLQCIDDKYSNILKEQCLICFDEMKNPLLETNCQNMFCGECLLKWLQSKNSCPACRSFVKPEDLIYIDTEKKNSSDKKFILEKKLSKLERTIDIINNNKDGRFLIFSEYDNTFHPICKVLIDNNINFEELKGNIKSREKTLDNFRSGKLTVLFLNSTFNAAGINLIEATDIILFHTMSIAQETQIVGRANRIGRTEKLKVHHLLINDI